MYRTCLFCNGSLGSNETLERFPVGRRIAFDAAHGRLWVVCRSCARWNLSPLETRWEAIEDAERLYRDTRTRIATDNIGLARVREGMELVRIGAPLRPEFAAWRYGDQFARRRRRALLMGVGSAAVLGAIAVGPWALGAGASIIGGFQHAQFAHMAYEKVRARRFRLPITDANGQPLRLAPEDPNSARLRWDAAASDWQLSFQHRRLEPERRLRRLIGIRQRLTLDKEGTVLHGPAAMRALGILLPVINGKGAARGVVSDAVTLVAEKPDPSRLLKEAPGYLARVDDQRQHHVWHLAPHIRLALEMAHHEDDERRALEGELAELEMRWREADEIARIADSLTLPSSVDDRLRVLRSDARQDGEDGEQRERVT